MCVSKRLRLLYPGFIVVFVVLVVVLLGVVVLIVVIIIIIVVVMFSDLLSILVGMVAVFLVLLLQCSQFSHAVPLPCAPPPPPPQDTAAGWAECGHRWPSLKKPSKVSRICDQTGRESGLQGNRRSGHLYQ